MFLVVGRRFRLLRWDRAGVIATPAIDYYEHPDVLCDILLRVSRLKEHELGFDSSAARLRPMDVDFLRMDVASLNDPADLSHAERKLEERETERPPVFEYVRSLFKTSLKGNWPRYRLEVPDGAKAREFLVAKPVFCADDLVGRGTRGYVALDCKTGRFVWLKDAWRASYAIIEAEGDILGRLYSAGIENIPTLICHGDIHDQATITGDFWERQQRPPSSPRPPSSLWSTPASCNTLPTSSEDSRKRKRVEEPEAISVLPANATAKSDCPLRQHKHYRIVVQEVCMPLASFQYGRQLLSIVLDCLRGGWLNVRCRTSLTEHLQHITRQPRTLKLGFFIAISAEAISSYIPESEETSTAKTPAWCGLVSSAIGSFQSRSTSKRPRREPLRRSEWYASLIPM